MGEEGSSHSFKKLFITEKSDNSYYPNSYPLGLGCCYFLPILCHGANMEINPQMHSQVTLYLDSLDSVRVRLNIMS